MVVMKTSLVITLFIILLSGNASAADEDPQWYEKRRGEIRAGAFFVTSNHTRVLIESNTNPLAASVNFQEDLGLESDSAVARLRFGYQFSKKHRLDASWFAINRDGQKVVEKEINIGDITIPVGATANVKFDTEILKVAYTHMFYSSPKVRLGFSAGLNFSGIDIGVDFESMPPAPPSTGQQEADGVAPLPVIGFRLAYSLKRNWLVVATADLFAVQFGDYSGSLTDFEFLIENRTFKHVGFGVGLERLAFDLEATDTNFTGNFQTTLVGVNAYVSFYF